jgi:hypothetical protein
MTQNIKYAAWTTSPSSGAVSAMRQEAAYALAEAIGTAEITEVRRIPSEEVGEGREGVYVTYDEDEGSPVTLEGMLDLIDTALTL